MGSGSSKGGREGTSDARPRGPSGEACTDELFVIICDASGNMIGEACMELEVVTEERLTADAGTEV